MEPAEQSTSGALQPLQTNQESLKDRAYVAIRMAIVNREIPPGSRVSEARLAAMLNVSKTPVREALLRLAHVGLVESDGRYGIRVPQPSTQALRAAYDLREGLEAQSARLAAACVKTEAALHELESLAASCLNSAQDGDNATFRKLDRKFHLALASVNQNSYLRRLIGEIYDLTWSLRVRDAPVEGLAVECGRQHLEVLRAVAAGDANGADAQMREHIAKIRDAVLEAFPTPHQ